MKGSDVHALGVLLLGPGGTSELLKEELSVLAQRMVATRPEDRPPAAEVHKKLEDLVDFEPGLHRLRSQVDEVVGDAPKVVFEDLLQFAASATMAHGGFVEWDVARAMEVSLLLNNLFTRLVAERRGSAAAALAQLPVEKDKELSLNSVGFRASEAGIESLRVWTVAPVKAVGLLRNAMAHPRNRARLIAEARRELKSSEANAPREFRRAVGEVACLIDALIDPSATVVRRFVAFFGVENQQ